MISSNQLECTFLNLTNYQLTTFLCPRSSYGRSVKNSSINILDIPSKSEEEFSDSDDSIKDNDYNPTIAQRNESDSESENEIRRNNSGEESLDDPMIAPSQKKIPAARITQSSKKEKLFDWTKKNPLHSSVQIDTKHIKICQNLS